MQIREVVMRSSLHYDLISSFQLFPPEELDLLEIFPFAQPQIASDYHQMGLCHVSQRHVSRAKQTCLLGFMYNRIHPRIQRTHASDVNSEQFARFVFLLGFVLAEGIRNREDMKLP